MHVRKRTVKENIFPSDGVFFSPFTPTQGCEILKEERIKSKKKKWKYRSEETTFTL
jgi:hypothetical protein